MNDSKKSSIGKLASKIEGSLAASAISVPPAFGDLIGNAVGLLMELTGMSQFDGAENRIRGILLASSFSTTGLKIGRGVIIHGRKKIRFGNNVSIADGVFLSASGDLGRIEIGSNTHIDVRSVFYGQGGLTIGTDCAIASGVIIYTQTNQYDVRPLEKIIGQGTKYAPVEIGNGVWIGAGAKVLPGVTIGDHVVVGAGAVVTRNVEAWKVVVGVPAHVVKDRRGE